MIMETIKKYFLESGMTQAEFARRLNVTHMAVSGWFKGKRCPSSYYIEKMADVLHLTININKEENK